MKILAAALAGALLGGMCGHAYANVVYSYTGSTFDKFQDDPIPSGSYTPSMNVSGSFTVAAPLVGFTGYVTPLSFSFSDGRNTITDSNVTAPFNTFYLQTDAIGNIISWNVGLGRYVGSFGAVNVGDQFFGILTVGSGTTSALDQGETQEHLSNNLFGTDEAMALGPLGNGSPASWSVSLVPLPGALPLFATGLGALGLLSWRRKKKLAA